MKKDYGKLKKQKKPEYHAWRQRKEYFGELEQFDGSYHYWFEDRLLDEFGNPQEVCLLAAIDDATSQITHAKFDFNEGVVAVFTFWKEYVDVQGKPLGVYLDKYSTYKINHKNNVHRILTQKEKRSLNSIFSVKSARRVNHDFTIQFKNYFYQLEEIQPVTIRPKEGILVEEWLNGTIHFKFKEKYLNCFVLPEKPKKITKQPIILTNHPLNWNPPANHPWRQYKNKIP